MDYGTTAKTAISDLTIKHAHCWHTDTIFSKFHFGLGRYDDMDFTSRSNMSTTTDYITSLAISSIRLSDGEVAQLAANSTFASDSKNWQRLKPSAVQSMML
jgi:hypothetical protein